jgi:hypothetical protein
MTMTTFSTARITRRVLLQPASLHRTPQNLSSFQFQSATRTSRAFSMLHSKNANHYNGSLPFPKSRRAWMSTTPPGGDISMNAKPSSPGAGASTKDESSETASASSASLETPRRIVVRSEKKSAGGQKKSSSSNNHRGDHHRGATIEKEHDVQLQMDQFPKNVGYMYRRRRPSSNSNSNSNSQRRQQPSGTESTMIQDSHGVPILIPGRERILPGQSSHHSQLQRHQRKLFQLSTIHAPALLNTKEYCLQSAKAATTKSGTEAARRLLRGKKDVVKILRQHVVYPNTSYNNKDQQYRDQYHPHNTNNKDQLPLPGPYTLTGHGVPTQLLQNHLDLAGQLLQFAGNAPEVSFQNWSGALSLDWMRVRSQDGNSSVRPWPLQHSHSHSQQQQQGRSVTDSMTNTSNEWEQDMALYLSVMNRLATQLSVVLQSNSASAGPSRTNTTTTTTTSTRTNSVTSTTTATTNKDNDTNDSDHHNAFSSLLNAGDQSEQHIPMHPPPPRYWNVKVWRGLAFSADSLPAVLSPVVEWTPIQGSLEAPGHVCIRLQGFPTMTNDMSSSSSLRRRQPQAVTLSFNACFRNSSGSS